MCDCDYFHLCIYSHCVTITLNIQLERSVAVLGNLVKQLAIENNVTEEIVESSIEKIITSLMDGMSNDKYTLWNTVFGDKRPSVEEFLEKMDNLTIKK